MLTACLLCALTTTSEISLVGSEGGKPTKGGTGCSGGGIANIIPRSPFYPGVYLVSDALTMLARAWLPRSLTVTTLCLLSLFLPARRIRAAPLSLAIARAASPRLASFPAATPSVTRFARSCLAIASPKTSPYLPRWRTETAHRCAVATGAEV
jgi:hypothetical protein